MTVIADLLRRDLARKIEEIIQVDQADEESVHAEITEYVATDSIRDNYHLLLDAIARAPSEPHEGVGVWVSGFFGSGKSSFAKNLGYALQNRPVLGTPFAELFKRQVSDDRVANLLDSINARTPTGVILFEVAKELDTRQKTQRIAELMYTVLLRELDYAEDFDIAELEIELEDREMHLAFVEKCDELYKEGWRKVRKSSSRISRTSRVLHEVDPKSFATPDSWAHTQKDQNAAITVSRVVERTFDLWGRRRKGQALVFIIDEVGQHVARSGDKIEDLRATVEEFGKVGKNLLKKRRIPAPCWVVVTSQEKLDEVVSALGDDKRIDLAKLQDRFRHRVDLAPSDIREVATKRVLAKTTEAGPLLKKLFADNQGSLNAALRLERTARPTDIGEGDFAQFYPYPPHYIDLCIGIMSGIRLQPGAPRHYGGSNRTIIKQAYEMLVSERTAFAQRPVGALVTLDLVFELVEGNLSTEKRTDLHEIAERFKPDTEDGGWALRAAKAVCLLEFVRDLPRTEANVAAFLIDAVGKLSPRKEVRAALGRLEGAKFVRNTEDGWKLQTAQEKTWTSERGSHLEPKPRDRNDLTRQALRQIFDEPEFKTYRHLAHRTFRVGVRVGGAALGDEGDLPLLMKIADDADGYAAAVSEAREESRQRSHENELYWVFHLTPEAGDLVAQLHASRRMVEKYDQLRAQNKITTDEAACLQDEKTAALGYQSRLRDKLAECMERGAGMFRGVQKDAAGLGRGLAEVLRKLFAHAVPSLYPKLEMGARPLKGDEAEQLLKAADLKALPGVFYAGEGGLGLVVRDGAKSVIRATADVAKEVLDYLKSESGYGNKDSRMGKALERHFTSCPYGWEQDMVRLILAALFRAGEVDVTYQGSRFANYQDPASRAPFAKTQAFRASLFSPRQSVGLKTLTLAVQQLEDLTGEEVDVEEGAIAAAFKKVVAEELERLHPLKALADAHRLPVAPMLAEYQQTLIGVQASASDDCVRTLTEVGAAFGVTREQVRRLREALDDKALGLLKEARGAVERLWPSLASYQHSPEVAPCVGDLVALLGEGFRAEALADIAAKTRVVRDAYRQTYLALFDRRAEAYRRAIGEVKNRAEWGPLSETSPALTESLLAPLAARVGTDEDRAAGDSGAGRASLAEMESDLAAADGLRSAAVSKLQELSMGGEKTAPVRRVRLAGVFGRPIRSPDDLDAAVGMLRDAVQKYLDEGAAIILE